MTDKVFLFRLQSTPDDHENYGEMWGSFPATMETVNALGEGQEWVRRVRDANMLPEKFSSIAIAMDGEFWHDDINAEYDMEDDERMDKVDRLINEIWDHGVVMMDRDELIRMASPAEFGPTLRFYIDGERFSVLGVAPHGTLCASILLDSEKFAEAIERTHSPADQEYWYGNQKVRATLVGSGSSDEHALGAGADDGPEESEVDPEGPSAHPGVAPSGYRGPREPGHPGGTPPGVPSGSTG